MFTTADTILAIDLGRYKSVACVYQRSSREHSFLTFDTTPTELDKLLARRTRSHRGGSDNKLSHIAWHTVTWGLVLLRYTRSTQ